MGFNAASEWVYLYGRSKSNVEKDATFSATAVISYINSTLSVSFVRWQSGSTQSVDFKVNVKKDSTNSYITVNGTATLGGTSITLLEHMEDLQANGSTLITEWYDVSVSATVNVPGYASYIQTVSNTIIVQKVIPE